MKEDRSTSWWLATLRRRAERQREESLDLSAPVHWASAAEQSAAIRFFNAAFRAEESGLRQAHELADELKRLDPELSEVLRLYGNEEGWHRELLTEFLPYIGGGIRPMGRVTRTLYWLYGRARRMETIVLTNLMFEIIGSTTYRMALRNVSQPQARRMLTILTRDEAFHVPLNVHFLKRVLQARPQASRWRLKLVYHLLFVSLLALPLASRPKAFAFDKITRLELMRGYARMLGGLFTHDATLGLQPPRWALAALGILPEELRVSAGLTGVEAAERAADREVVSVTAL